MITHLHGKGYPYRLLSNIVYFHDWRYVHMGAFAWEARDGSSVARWGFDPLPPMRMRPIDMPSGIRLAMQPAQKSEPVFTAADAEEVMLFYATVICDGGRYRLWYESWPREDIGVHPIGNYNYLRYAESEDGITWTRPKLGLVEQCGSRENNSVYGGRTLTPASGFTGGSVFIDPSAPPEERYKLFHQGLVNEDTLAKFRAERPNDVDPGFCDVGIYGAVSPDGLRWTPLPDPLVLQQSDTHNVCEYDAVRRKYVGYCRSWLYERRTIGRMETDDFRRFPLCEEVLWPNAMMAPSDQWYLSAKTMMPGTVDYHVMFPLRWSMPEDTFDFHLMTSPDGIVWGFVPGGPVCRRGEPGEWDPGLVSPCLGLVELPGDRMGILFAGADVPHKHPRRPPLGALAWAWWPKGRLVALEAPDDGAFTTFWLLFDGRTARLNFSTTNVGSILVEAVGVDGNVIPGHAFADCDPLSGNHLDAPVTWHGNPDLGHADGTPVILRFRLHAAKLFSIRFA